VKKFRNLWYTGLAITGIPVIIIIFASFLVLVKNIKTHPVQMEEDKEQVQDTVYIRVPNPKPQPTQVKDTL